MRQISFLGSLCLSIGLVALAEGQSAVPDALLRVTVQQMTEGVLDPAFHVIELNCTSGNCVLTTVTINQCQDLGGGQRAFYPKAQVAATLNGTLRVSRSGNTLATREVLVDNTGETIITKRFEYEPAGQGQVVRKLVGFSGGYIKDSAILKRVIVTKYSPLTGVGQVRTLACDVVLPGIDPT